MKKWLIILALLAGGGIYGVFDGLPREGPEKSATRTVPAVEPAVAPQTILVLGDSLSAAHGLAKEEGWVALAAASLGSRHTVVNASRMGQTTNRGRERLPDLLDRHKPDVLILELGINDYWQDVPLPETVANLEAMLDLAEKRRIKVLVAGMDLPLFIKIRYPYYREFGTAFADLARERNLAYVPFLLDGLSYDSVHFQSDGMHPTAAAQKIILKNVLPSLQQVLRTPVPQRGEPSKAAGAADPLFLQLHRHAGFDELAELPGVPVGQPDAAV